MATLLTNGRIWQWSQAALAGPKAMLAAADEGTAHTLARYETAFYQPMVSDWRNFETWEEAGALTATQRANGIWKQMLKDYEQPPLDPAIDEELKAFMARRKEEEKAAA